MTSPSILDAPITQMPIQPTRHAHIGMNGTSGAASGYSYHDFYAHMPTHKYLHVPTGELWPASSVNAKLSQKEIDGSVIKASTWLDEHRAVMQLVWMPGERQVIEGRLMQAAGWQVHAGARSFNLYVPPSPVTGDAKKIGAWIGHLERLYPDDWAYIVNWFAWTVQHPEDKINCALVLGGGPGIGKDTLIEPLRMAVGAHNVADITPAIMFARFNRWARNKLVRVSEVRDLGDLDRYSFYEHCKPYLASPPDVIRVDEKNLREYYVANACNFIFTTNHLTDGLYLPADDRRHCVVWSTRTSADFTEAYFRKFWTWYEDGGMANVVAFLHERDLSEFDPKAPPPKTPAFWQMVAASEAPESGEMRDAIDALGNPDALTVSNVSEAAFDAKLFGLHDELKASANRRAMPHKMERVGYSAVRNPDAADGQFKVAGKRTTVYARSALTVAARVEAARRYARANGVIEKPKQRAQE
ncbi:primase-helicase family protein [Paraburkholderia sp. BR14320]|uniref:primase-helicase family protein n=1 Tax=unclassified Paraburkholderia TaxID=2615204 RepID=UPI0034CE046B